MLAICSALEILPARTYAGSPPIQLNRRKTSRMTPSMVGIICQTRLKMYAYICSLLPLRLNHAPRVIGLVAVRAAAVTAARSARPVLFVLLPRIDVDVL